MLATLLMAGAAITSCTSDDVVPDPQPNDEQTYLLTIVAEKGSDVLTRALGYSGTSLVSTWETTDEVSVYNETKGAWLTGMLKPESAGASATLSGTLTGTVDVDDILSLQYPAQTRDYVGQDGTLAKLASDYDYILGRAQVATISGDKITVNQVGGTPGNIIFQNQQAIVKFILYMPDGTTPFDATNVTIDALDGCGHSRLIQNATIDGTMTLGPIITSPSATNVIYAALSTKADEALRYKIAANDGTDYYSYTRSGVTFSNGKYYEIGVRMQPDASYMPLTIEATVDATTVTFENKATGSVTYRIDGGAANTISSNSSEDIVLSAGQTVAFYGDNATYYNSGSSHISCDKDCYIYGNVMSLISSTDFASVTTLTGEKNFSQLFETSDSEHLISHPTKDIVLSATTLTERCYFRMFMGCSGLTKAPDLPATTLAPYCYTRIFSGCGFTTAPALPATTMVEGCYMTMFELCTSLTEAPVLHSTDLALTCYSNMFHTCTSLTTAPDLPATTLAEGCYNSMFTGCSSLTVVPVLPATKLAKESYANMFCGCSSLSLLTILASDVTADNCITAMLSGVSSAGTLYTPIPDVWKPYLPSWTVTTP